MEGSRAMRFYEVYRVKGSDLIHEGSYAGASPDQVLSGIGPPRPGERYSVHASRDPLRHLNLLNSCVERAERYAKAGDDRRARYWRYEAEILAREVEDMKRSASMAAQDASSDGSQQPIRGDSAA